MNRNYFTATVSLETIHLTISTKAINHLSYKHIKDCYQCIWQRPVWAEFF